MGALLPDTPATLLSRLKDPSGHSSWNDDWEQFVRDYNRAVHAMVVGELKRILHWMTPPQNMIEDVEALVWTSISELQTGRRPYDRRVGKFRTILRRLVSRRAVDVIRKSQRLFKEQSIDLPEDGQGEDAPSVADQAEDPVPSEEERRAFREALLKSLIDEVRGRVSPEQMAIFELVKLHGESPVEVAEQFGKSRAAIDKTISRVLVLFREIALRPEYQEEYHE